MPQDNRIDRALTAVLVIAAVAGVGALVGALWRSGKTGDRPLAQYTGRRILVLDQRVFGRPRRYSTTDAGRVLHSARFVAHGGLARIEWFDGRWAPLAPRRTSDVSLYLDGRRRASTRVAANRGAHESRFGSIIWAGRFGPGPHTVQVRLDRVGGRVALPYTAAGSRVADSLAVTEYDG